MGANKLVLLNKSLKPMARYVFFGLAALSEEGMVRGMTTDQIAKILAIHTPTFTRYTKKLEAAGLLAVHRKPGRARNQYELHPEFLIWDEII